MSSDPVNLSPDVVAGYGRLWGGWYAGPEVPSGSRRRMSLTRERAGWGSLSMAEVTELARFLFSETEEGPKRCGQEGPYYPYEECALPEGHVGTHLAPQGWL